MTKTYKYCSKPRSNDEEIKVLRIDTAVQSEVTLVWISCNAWVIFCKQTEEEKKIERVVLQSSEEEPMMNATVNFC